MSSRTCSECLKRFPDAQIQSLEAVLRWLDEWPPEGAARVNASLRERLCAVRDSPDCATQCVRNAPPFRRDAEVIACVVPPLPSAMKRFFWLSVEIEARLQKRVLTWLQPEVAVERDARLVLSDVSRHAVVFANNLLMTANPAETCDADAHCRLATQSFDALNEALDRALLSDQAGERLQAADLIFLNGLNRSVRQVCGFAVAFEKPVPAPRAGLGAGWRWFAAGLGVLGICGALAAGCADELGQGVRMIAGVAAGVCGLVAVVLAACTVAWRRVSMTEDPDTTWAGHLKVALQEEFTLYDRVLGTGEGSLDGVDLLSDAGNLFANTRLAKTSEVARFLMRIVETPLGPSLLRWIARHAAEQAGVARLCAVAEALLDEDCTGEGGRPVVSWAGSCLAAQLVREFTHTFDESEQRRKELWKHVVPVSGTDTGGRAFDFPRLVRRLFLHVALLEACGTLRWTAREGQFVLACRELDDLCLRRAPTVDLHGHLFQVRFLADVLREEGGELRFPARSHGSLSALCGAVEYALSVADAELVRNLRADEEWAKGSADALLATYDETHGGIAADGMAEPDAPVRAALVREALDVMTMDGFALSKEYLPLPPEPPRWRRPQLKLGRGSLFDAFINAALGGGPRLAPSPVPSPCEPPVSSVDLSNVRVGGSLRELLKSDKASGVASRR